MIKFLIYIFIFYLILLASIFTWLMAPYKTNIYPYFSENMYNLSKNLKSKEFVYFILYHHYYGLMIKYFNSRYTCIDSFS